MTQDAGAAGPAITQQPRFDMARRGYERSQVDQHLALLYQQVSRLTANLRQERDVARTGSAQLLAERDEALRQLRVARAELASLRGGVDTATTVELAASKDEISLFGDRLQTILTTAEQEAKAARAEAMRAAERVRVEAEQRAAALLSEAERRAATLRSETEEQASSLLSRARQDADELQAMARQEANDVLTTARQEATRLAEETSAEAERLVTTARREAAAALDAARREEHETRTSLAELIQRREQVRHQLTDIGTAIESLLGDGDAVHAATENPPTGAGAAPTQDTVSPQKTASTQETVAMPRPQPSARPELAGRAETPAQAMPRRQQR